MVFIRSKAQSLPPGAETFRQYLDRKIQADPEVIDLLVAFPYFSPPPHVQETYRKAAAEGFFHYGSTRGYLPLRQAISRFLKTTQGIEANPDREIIITSGASGALFTAIWTFIDRGDEVILPDPTFQMITNNITMAGGIPIPLPLSRDFQLPVEEMARAVTSRTRMICLVNPDNPTGTVYPLECLREIARVAYERDLLVVTDEVHDQFVYEGTHISIATLPGMKERTIRVNSFSKTYGMGGLRVGYAIMPAELMDLFFKIHSNDNPHPCMASQVAAQAALEGPQDFLNGWKKECRVRRDLCVEALNQMDGIHCVRPQSGIVVFPDVSNRGTSEEVARMLIDRAQVATHPGSRYGKNGEGHLRICFASVPLPRLQEALERMKKAFA